MTFGMVAIAAALLLVVLLAFVVARLAAEVRRMSAQLDTLTSTRITPGNDLESSASIEASNPATQASSPATDGGRAAKADEEVPVITAMHLRAADDQAGLTAPRVASVTLAGPLIKVAAFSHGVRRALEEERRMRIAYVMRKELRRQRKMRRRRRARRTPAEGWKP